MNNVIGQLVWKDIQLHKFHIAFTTILGACSLALLLLRSEPATVVGSVLFLISVIISGSRLPNTNILDERKKQTLPLLMSLPISCAQYTTAKLAGTVAMFLIPWLILVAAAAWMIGIVGVLPAGVMPMALILAALPFVGLSIIMAVALVLETENWVMATSMVSNTSYGLTWYFITRTPALMRDLDNRQAVWNSAVVTFLGSELTLVALTLALTYYLQSRKRDFV
jgi:hypothetical protein